jgi:hypothetical protein
VPRPEINPQDLVQEWREAMESVIGAATSAAGRAELPRQLTAPMQRQAELLEELRELLGSFFGPFDAVFDLLEESGAAVRKQAEALSQSAQALEQAAELMRTQAELYERTIKVLREPAELAKSAAGVKGAKRRG